MVKHVTSHPAYPAYPYGQRLNAGAALFKPIVTAGAGQFHGKTAFFLTAA
jgi:hypothetical protein